MNFAQTNRTARGGLRRQEEKTKNRKTYNRIVKLHKIKRGIGIRKSPALQKEATFNGKT